MKIVSVSKVVPFPGIPHAGGDYYRRHIAALQSLGHDVTIVAPRDRRNSRAVGKVSQDLRVHLFGRRRASLLARYWDELSRILAPWSLPRRFINDFRRDSHVSAMLDGCDLIEVQWTE